MHPHRKICAGAAACRTQTQGKGSAGLPGQGRPALPGLRGGPKAAPAIRKASVSLSVWVGSNFLLRLGGASSIRFRILHSACGESSLRAAIHQKQSVFLFSSKSFNFLLRLVLRGLAPRTPTRSQVAFETPCPPPQGCGPILDAEAPPFQHPFSSGGSRVDSTSTAGQLRRGEAGPGSGTSSVGDEVAHGCPPPRRSGVSRLTGSCGKSSDSPTPLCGHVSSNSSGVRCSGPAPQQLAATRS